MLLQMRVHNLLTTLSAQLSQMLALLQCLITELINLYKFRKKEEKVMPTEVAIEEVTPIEE